MVGFFENEIEGKFFQLRFQENFSELANFRAIQNVVSQNSQDLIVSRISCQKIYQNIYVVVRGPHPEAWGGFG